ncbi:7442_t:CDS:2, partial [Entrophospora sp. SA101]
MFEEICVYKKRELPEFPEENYVCELHHDIDWVNFAMHAIIREYESGSLKIHGESSSLASALRKNLGHTVPGIKQLARSKMGQRADLVLHVSSDLEF